MVVFPVPTGRLLDAFSSSLTTTVFSQRSMRRFGASPRRTAPKGQPSSLVQHRIKNPYLNAGLLSAFVTHCGQGLGSPVGDEVFYCALEKDLNEDSRRGVLLPH